ncbi:hypothetical protein D1N57_20845, partial [Clostridioides difficile]
GMYDAVVLGNHEFVSEKDEFWSDERLLDAVIEDFEQVAISVLLLLLHQNYFYMYAVLFFHVYDLLQ